MFSRANIFSGFVGLLVASFAIAGDGHPSIDKDGADVHAQRSPVSAQRIYLDPSSGELRDPTPEERKQFRTQEEQIESKPSAESNKKVRFSNGAVGVYLKQPKKIAQAHVSKDGHIEINCNEDDHAHEAQP